MSILAIRITFAAAFVFGLTVFQSGTAVAIPHDGVTLGCNNCGGVRFSSVHRSNNGSEASANGLNLSITPGTDIQYSWTPDGAVTSTSKQVFDRGSSRIVDTSISGLGAFTIDLWTGATGSNPGDLNVLAARGTGAPSNPGPHLGFTLTEKVSGRFGFTITAGGAQLFDVFVFDEFMDMGPVDAFGNNGAGDVGTFLWGYTADYSASGQSSHVCLAGDCSDIIGTLYGSAGLGLDLAYSGTAVVPEPGALALLGFGLLGFGVARRRA